MLFPESRHHLEKQERKEISITKKLDFELTKYLSKRLHLNEQVWDAKFKFVFTNIQQNGGLEHLN